MGAVYRATDTITARVALKTLLHRPRRTRRGGVASHAKRRSSNAYTPQLRALIATAVRWRAIYVAMELLEG